MPVASCQLEMKRTSTQMARGPPTFNGYRGARLDRNTEAPRPLLVRACNIPGASRETKARERNESISRDGLLVKVRTFRCF